MPTSEARIAANRRNALKSTGPRTAEGKARSRTNARTHGLTGEGIALPEEDAAAVAARFEALHDQLDPRTPLGAVLVQRVAMLSVRLDRSYRRERASLAARVSGAAAAFDDARRSEAEYMMNHLCLEPRTYARRLMASPIGVDLLIEGFRALKDAVENPEGNTWEYHHLHRAENMLGLETGHIAPTAYLAWTHALKGNYHHISPASLAGLSDDARQQLALERLAGLVDADLARLVEHRATMDVSGFEAQRALAPEIALFDDSDQGILHRKYEAATERGLYRALKELREAEADAPADQPHPATVAPDPDAGLPSPRTRPSWVRFSPTPREPDRCPPPSPTRPGEPAGMTPSRPPGRSNTSP